MRDNRRPRRSRRSRSSRRAIRRLVAITAVGGLLAIMVGPQPLRSASDSRDASARNGLTQDEFERHVVSPGYSRQLRSAPLGGGPLDAGDQSLISGGPADNSWKSISLQARRSRSRLSNRIGDTSTRSRRGITTQDIKAQWETIDDVGIDLDETILTDRVTKARLLDPNSEALSSDETAGFDIMGTSDALRSDRRSLESWRSLGAEHFRVKTD